MINRSEESHVENLFARWGCWRGYDILLKMHLNGRLGGHALGIHRTVDTSSRASISDSAYSSEGDDDSSWEILSHDTIHFFDPNVGEFYLSADQFPLFLMELINNVYHTPIVGSAFSLLVIQRQPIYW